jgi:hypothetical protein
MLCHDDAFISANNSYAALIDQHLYGFWNLVDEDKLIQDQEKWEERLSKYSILSTSLSPVPEWIDGLKGKIQKVRDFDACSRGLYDEVKRLSELVQRGQTERGKVTFDPQTLTYSFDGIDPETMITLMYEGYFVGDGSLNLAKVKSQLLARGDKLTDLEIEVVVRLLNDPRVSYNDLIQLFNRYGSDPNSSWKDMTYELPPRVADRIAEEMSVRLGAEVDKLLLQGKLTRTQDELTDEEIEHRKRLTRLMRRAQLVTFIANNPRATILSLDNFEQTGEIRVRGKENNPYIASRLDALLGKDNGKVPFSEAMDILAKLVHDYQVSEAELSGHIVNLLLDAGGFVPVVGKVADIADVTASAVNLIIHLIAHDDKLSAAEKSYAQALLAKAIARLGGGVSMVEGVSGLSVAGHTFTTPEAMITLSGLLQYDPTLTPDQVILILMDKNHPRYREVDGYLNEYYLGRRYPPREEYGRLLSRTYEAHYSEIIQKYGSKYPELADDALPHKLPPEVLQEVIEKAGKVS